MENPSTSSHQIRKKFDVFISFRGEDTRYSFTGFLYDALYRLGIMTFMDDKKFQIGDNLNDLYQIIEESRSSIVVLSKDYASAKWCLRELVKIMDCMGSTSHRVLPVFYHVDPSDVRNQSGIFKHSFDQHETISHDNDEEKEKHLKEVQKWRDAMRKIGTHTGVVITKDSSEVDVVKKIADQIFNSWRPKLVATKKNLVGMTSRLLQMNVHLALGLDDVRYVGIVGSGGIGKTTIAEVVFDCLIPEFEDRCFVTISGGDPKPNLISLQYQLLSRIFQKENIKIWHENDGAEMIRNRLSDRKVLLVLDGVDEKRQLEKLAGSPDWFGPGSRVIITTRNKDSLHQPNNFEIKVYNVELLDNDSALQLFCKNAFGMDHPDNNFKDLSYEIVEKVGRLPLALRVIGSFLNRKEVDIWKETLKSLIKVNEKDLFDILKISYDGLEAESQKVFLDLACFFNGKREDRVIEILDSFGYGPRSQILLLMERCLIQVSHKKILMHDLILDMGQEIVRRESLTQPGKQSRIWLQEDVYRVFIEEHGLRYVEGIVLNLEEEQEEELQLEAKCFSDMKSLKILEINNVGLNEDIKYLSNLLRLLNWPGFPLKCLPSTFQPRYLFELLLPHSHIVRLWEGRKRFERLKVIDASGSEFLVETPDFSGVPNLRRLVLRNCVRLCVIHPSINFLSNLLYLDLKNCSSLRSFLSSISCKSLQTLILTDTGLESFPEIERNMGHLAELYLDGTSIMELHPSFEYLIGLVLLDLRNCCRLSNLPDGMGSLRSLKTLLLNGCSNLSQIPPSLGNTESNLEHLDIGKTSITHAPSTAHCLRNLQTLNCESLSRSIWVSLLPPSTDSGGFESLKYLNLSGCNLEDEDIPKDLHCFSSLENLNISGNNFVRLSKSLSHLSNLKKLILTDCIKLRQLTRLPTNIRYVGGGNCKSMSQQFYNKIYQIPKDFGYLVLDFPINLDARTIEYLGAQLSEQRLIEVRTWDGEVYDLTSESVKVFECFEQANEGNWIEIQYSGEPSTNSAKSNVLGVILSVDIQCLQTSEAIDGQFLVHLETDGYPSNWSLPERKPILTSRTRAWVLYIPFNMFSNGLLTQNSFYIKAGIRSQNKHVMVKACGASVLSWKNTAEFLANMFNKLFLSDVTVFRRRIRDLDHKNHCRCDKVKTTAKDCFEFVSIESETDPDFLLKSNLKSMLRRIFQEDKTVSNYFFSQRDLEISGWFRNQDKKKDKVTVKLPRNLHKDKKWMGLAMFVVFSIYISVEDQSDSDDLNNNNHFFSCEMQSEKGSLQRISRFQIPLELFEDSNQILALIFEPREWYPYGLDHKWDDHLFIGFFTDKECIKVEMSGARLVYQQNVEGLVHTIVDCSLNSGECLYKYNNMQIMRNFLSMIRSQGIWRYQHPSLHEQPVTPPGCGDDLISSVSVEKLLHQSFTHPLFEKSIQERYSSKFDVILYGRQIPAFFTNRIVWSKVTIKVPRGLDDSTKSVGFVVCAVVAVNEKTGKTDSSPPKVLELKCQFGVDLHQMEPVHSHFVTEKKILTQHAPGFLWLFYTPLTAFQIFWEHCSSLEISLDTNDNKTFQVSQCGLHLICKKERKEIDKIIMESLLPPSTTQSLLPPSTTQTTTMITTEREVRFFCTFRCADYEV